ncbi:MAG: dienelactone hydrolase family protein [Pseudomonadales bacterium]|jgi:carboxymethylenebutenolidase|nr:dienelactone hydrolase family protein [Pseudomonadales bacterium]
MCDLDTLQDSIAYLQRTPFSRRQFGALSVGAGMAMMLPPVANAQAVTERDVEITTPDGVADAYFVHPASGSAPAVLVWPDILGLRPAFRAMGKRLAESGYAVLVINPFYRSAKSPVVPEGANFQDDAVRNTVMPMAQKLTADTHVTDARAFIAWLDQQSAVNTSRKMGTIGYCMGGPMVMRAAATAPARVGAAGTFHGAGLATAGKDSPHLLIPQMQASFLIAIATNDDEREPDAKKTLRETFDAKGLKAEIEVYPESLHGWCVIDSAAYNQATAEKAWGRLLALFESALA